MKPIPISAAERIARNFGYDQVIVIARKVGDAPAPHGEHVTTYGVDREHCGVAARVGNFIKHKIMDWPEHEVSASVPVFVNVTKDLTVNRDHVATVAWDRRHYANGSESWLVISMADGQVHRIQNRHGLYDAPDLYKVERELTGGDRG